MVDVWQEYNYGKGKDKENKKKRKKDAGFTIKVTDMPKEKGSALAEIIERQANAQRAKQQPKVATEIPGLGAPDPIADLMSSFMGQYNSINVPRTPLEKLQEMASSQVNAQFNPMIDLLNQQMSSKKKRGAASQKEAREMYDALSQSFLSELPEMTQQFAAEDRETNQRYDTAQKQLQDMYGQQANQQDALLQQLGISAAAPEASQQARDDQKYFQGQMELDQQSARSTQDVQQNAAMNYQDQLGDTTRIAGENTAQDIGKMLEEYLDSANTQMGGLQAQKSSTLAQLVQQMQAQDADRAAKEEQKQFDNLLALSRFQLDAAKAQGANTKKADELFKGTTGLSGAQNFLGQQYSTSPQKASGIMEQLNSVLSNPDVVKGKFQLAPGDPSLGKAPTYSDVGQEYMMDLLRQSMEKSNNQYADRFGGGSRYDTGDINNAINALLAYMGKLR